MNWEAVGAVGEIVGAAAVVITLIYLAVQMKLSRMESQIQSSYSTLEVYGNWRAHLIDNEKLAASVVKADRGEALAPEEEIQVETLMDDLFIALAVSSVSGAQAEAFYSSSSEIEYLARIFSQHPGLAAYWDRTRDYISIVVPEFAAAVDALLVDDNQLGGCQPNG